MDAQSSRPHVTPWACRARGLLTLRAPHAGFVRRSASSKLRHEIATDGIRQAARLRLLIMTCPVTAAAAARCRGRCRQGGAGRSRKAVVRRVEGPVSAIAPTASRRLRRPGCCPRGSGAVQGEARRTLTGSPTARWHSPKRDPGLKICLHGVVACQMASTVGHCTV